MKRTITFLSVLALLLSFQEANSQSIRSLIRNKIIEDQLESQAKRDSARAVEAGEEPDPSPNTTMDQVYMDALGLSGNVDYEPVYTFDAYIQMEVSEFRKNDNLKDKVVYDSYLSNQGMDYAMEFEDKSNKSTIIFDSENSAMLFLSDNEGEYTGFAMSMDPEAIAKQAAEYAEESETDRYKPQKTGKTKTILGYLCEEYLVEDDESESHMWVSEKLGNQVRRELFNNQQAFSGMFSHAAYLNGMALEYDYLDKSDGDRTLMKVTKIDLNHSHSISTKKYAVMTMKAPPQDSGKE